MATNSKPEETPEYRTFREHYDRLVTAIQDPLPLTTRLFARSIIDSTLLQRVSIPALPPFQNTNTLLIAVLGKIQTDPNTLCKVKRGNSDLVSCPHRIFRVRPLGEK